MSPLKITWKTELVALLCVIGSWPLAAYFYARFPERVASHWNFSGQVDGWSGRGLAAFLLPVLLAVMYALFLGLPVFDPHRERYGEFAAVYHIFKSAFLGVLFAIYAATGLYNLGYPVDIGLLVPFLIGALFVLIGAGLGRVKPNWFVGIRTPWTLSSETVWNRTHKLGGKLFALFGVALMAAPLLPPVVAGAVLVGGVVLLVVGTMGYSYAIYERERRGRGV